MVKIFLELKENENKKCDIFNSDDVKVFSDLEFSEANLIVSLVNNRSFVEEVIGRNLVAWDTSQDKKHSLLPEVYSSDSYLYKLLTGEDYNFSKVCRKYNID